MDDCAIDIDGLEVFIKGVTTNIWRETALTNAKAINKSIVEFELEFAGRTPVIKSPKSKRELDKVMWGYSCINSLIIFAILSWG